MQKVVQAVRQNSRLTTRELSSQLAISRSSIWRMLKERKFKIFKATPVQKLFPEDKERRFCFSRWFMEQLNNQATLPVDIMYSDESTFYLHPPRGLPHNKVWATENPRECIVHHTQYNPRVNVWCAIHGRTVLGPIFCSNKMNGRDYLQLLKGTLGPYIDNMPLVQRGRFYFQQDGAPIHTAKPVTQWLDENLPFQWIGLKASIKWPPRSPDLTPLDFFFWSFLKNKVHSRKPETLDELKLFILEECQGMDGDMLKRVCNNTVKRNTACFNTSGDVFENNIWINVLLVLRCFDALRSALEAWHFSHGVVL